MRRFLIQAEVHADLHSSAGALKSVGKGDIVLMAGFHQTTRTQLGRENNDVATLRVSGRRDNDSLGTPLKGCPRNRLCQGFQPRQLILLPRTGYQLSPGNLQPSQHSPFGKVQRCRNPAPVSYPQTWPEIFLRPARQVRFGIHLRVQSIRIQAPINSRNQLLNVPPASAQQGSNPCKPVVL